MIARIGVAAAAALLMAAKAAPEPRPIQVVTAAPVSVRVVDLPKSEAEYNPDCDPGNDDRKSDLCAQWKAADAARDAANYSLISLLVGILGTIGVIWTLRQTRDATQLDMRAYIRMEPDKLTVLKDEKIELELRLVNYGRTPALALTTTGRLLVRPLQWNWSSEPEQLKAPQDREELVLHPDAPYRVHAMSDSVLSQDALAAIREGRDTIYGFVSASYRDVFGRQRCTQIRFELLKGPDTNLADARMRVSPDGHVFT